MPGKAKALWLFLSLFFVTSLAFAQFSSSVQGTVQDPSGAGVANAKIELVNVGTNGTQATTSDPAGNFRFVSLAPGSYRVTVEAAGFSKSQVEITLLTEQNLSVPV